MSMPSTTRILIGRFDLSACHWQLGLILLTLGFTRRLSIPDGHTMEHRMMPVIATLLGLSPRPPALLPGTPKPLGKSQTRTRFAGGCSILSVLMPISLREPQLRHLSFSRSARHSG